jgi:hypothetical protein
MDASTSQAQARWEVENNIQNSNDQLLQFDEAEHQAVQAEAPWKKNPKHYTMCVRLHLQNLEHRHPP